MAPLCTADRWHKTSEAENAFSVPCPLEILHITSALFDQEDLFYHVTSLRITAHFLPSVEV